MRVPGRKLSRRILRPLRRKLFPGAAVLGYHRVAPTGWDPLGLAVEPDRFKAQVALMNTTRRLVSLGELAGRHANGEPLEQYAVMTFDDGYRDFVEAVLPVLESLEVPATVFVATGFTGRSFWWDEIAALLAPAPGPAALAISTGDGASWHFNGMDSPAERAAAAREMCNRLACSSETEIRSVIGQLREWAGAGSGSQRDGTAMSGAQLESLARHPLVEIGAHTVSHGCLGRLQPALQRAEIERSKADLEALTGAAVTVFSYPNGSYSRRTPELVEALGFSCACTSMEGAFSSRTNRYRIPRLWAPDAAEAEFRQWLGKLAPVTR